MTVGELKDIISKHKDWEAVEVQIGKGEIYSVREVVNIFCDDRERDKDMVGIKLVGEDGANG